MEKNDVAGEKENLQKSKYHTVTDQSKTVVFNEKNQIPQGFPKEFPTEREAVEYIGEYECDNIISE